MRSTFTKNAGYRVPMHIRNISENENPNPMRLKVDIDK